MRRLPRFALALLAAAAPACLRAADGDLDPLFDGDGLFVYVPDGPYSRTRALGAPDGAAVVFGDLPVTGAPAFHWRRLDPSGISPPCTFQPPGADLVQVRDATFDADGRLLLLADVRLNGQSERGLGVARYLYPACVPDAELDGDGYVHHAPAPAGLSGTFGAAISTARWTLLPPLWNHRILVAFSMQDASSTWYALLLRLRDDGTLDTGFGGGDGIAQAGELFAHALRRDLAGGFLLAGVVEDPSDSDTVVRRFDRDGALDTLFGESGTATLDLSPSGASHDELGALSVGPDGRIWLAGRTHTGSTSEADAAIAVLRADGAPDPGFSGDGWRLFEVAGAPFTSFRSVVAQGDGRVLAAGNFENPAEPDDEEALVVRFDGSGALDPVFGPGGVRVFAFDGVPGGDDAAAAVVVRPDGRLWVAGSTEADDGFGDTVFPPFLALLRNGYLFADGFERGSTGAW